MLEQRLLAGAVFLGLLVQAQAQAVFDGAPVDEHGRPLYRTDQYLVKYKEEEWARVVPIIPDMKVMEAVRAHHKAAGERGSPGRVLQRTMGLCTQYAGMLRECEQNEPVHTLGFYCPAVQV